MCVSLVRGVRCTTENRAGILHQSKWTMNCPTVVLDRVKKQAAVSGCLLSVFNYKAILLHAASSAAASTRFRAS